MYENCLIYLVDKSGIFVFFKSGLRNHADFAQRCPKIVDRHAEKSVKDARKHVKISYKYAQRLYKDFEKLRERSVRDAAYFTERRCIFS